MILVSEKLPTLLDPECVVHEDPRILSIVLFHSLDDCVSNLIDLTAADTGRHRHETAIRIQMSLSTR